MALEGRRRAHRARGTAEIPDKELPLALEALRDLGLFADLDSRGYGVGQPLNMGRRMYVRRMISEARHLYDYEKNKVTGQVIFSPSNNKNLVLYTPTTERQRAHAREGLGLTLKTWKSFPVPTLIGYKGKPVKIQTSTKKNQTGIVVDYPDWHLRHTIVPVHTQFIENFLDNNYADEEIDPKELLIEAYQAWARQITKGMPDGSWYRLTTKYGDVSPTKYGTDFSPQALIKNTLPRFLNKYIQTITDKDGDQRIDAPEVFTGLSIYQRTGKKALSQAVIKKASSNDARRPEKKRPRYKSQKMKVKHKGTI